MDMIAPLILPILTMLLPLLGLGPKVSVASTGKSNAFGVGVFSSEFSQSDNYGPAVLAQEVCEWWLMWSIGCLLSVPVMLGLSAADIGFTYFMAPLVQIFCCFWIFPFRKWWDSVGHNIEIMIAERYAPLSTDPRFKSYRKREIDRMMRDKNFRGMTNPEIDAYLKRSEGFAKTVESLLGRDWRAAHEKT